MMRLFSPLRRHSKIAGTEDKHREGAFLITVKLNNGSRVQCYVLPTDTARIVKQKIEHTFGPQTNFLSQKVLNVPSSRLCAEWRGRWLMMQWSATMRDIGLKKELRFEDATDFWHPTYARVGWTIVPIPIVF